MKDPNPREYSIGDMVVFYQNRVGIIIDDTTTYFPPSGQPHPYGGEFQVKTLGTIDSNQSVFVPYKRKHVYKRIGCYSFKHLPPAVIAKMKLEGILDNEGKFK